MRIGVLLDRWNPNGGGLEQYLHHVLPALVDRGHELGFVARDANLSPPRGVQAFPVESRLPVPRPWKDKLDQRVQKRAMQEWNPDAVLSLRSTSWEGAVWLPMSGSSTHLAKACGGRQSWRQRYFHKLEDECLAKAGIVAAPSIMVMSELADRHEDARFEHLPLPLFEQPKCLAPPFDYSTKAELRVVACGRDLYRHGAIAALQWFLHLQLSFPNATLSVWCKNRRRYARHVGMSFPELESHGVSVHEWDGQFLHALETAHLLFHPTRYDSFSLVCLEALARNVPVLTTLQAGLARECGASHCQVALEKGDDKTHLVASFATRMLKVSSQSGREREEEARKLQKRYSLDNHVARLESLLEECSNLAR